VQDEEFDELSQSEGYIPAPYLARAKWVMVVDPSKLSRKNLKNYLQQSYELIKAKVPRKVKDELGLD
jgi:predicted DNA-binding protein (MmcQ/YjbR family)